MGKNIIYQTPIKGFTKFKSCDSKIKYLNIDEAMIAGKFNMVKSKCDLYTYLCKICNKWHLTKKLTKYKVI